MAEDVGARAGRLADRARLESLQRVCVGAEPDEAFDRFASLVKRLLGVPVALVSLVDEERQFFPGQVGLPEPWDVKRETPLSHSFCQYVVIEGEAKVFPDARIYAQVRDNLAIPDLGVVAYAGMPLTDADGNVLGSLCAIDDQPRVWTDAELTTLSDLAAACSDSLRLRIANYHVQLEHDRVRLRESRTVAAFDRSQLLLRASTTLANAGDLEEVVGMIRDLVTSSLDPAYVGLSLTERGQISLQSGQLLPAHVADRWKKYPDGAATPSAMAARTGNPVLLPDLAAVEALTPDALATFHEMGWQAGAALPLPGENGPLGALTFLWKEPYALDDAEQAALAALAGYVAQTLRRVHLLEDRRTAAATMQKALLTPLPLHDGLRLAARYVPAHHEDHVGGDWYDAIKLDEERLALVIGDVTGHSIAAAAAMSQYRSMLRTLLIDRHEPPSALLRRLDHTSRALGNLGLTTVVLGYLDPDPAGGHLLTWSNAGHPPPTVVLPDGRMAVLEGHDPLLGAGLRISRRNHAWHLPPGTTLLLHTDGLIETRTSTLDDGMDRLHELLRKHPVSDPETLADVLVDHIGTACEDDVALLIVTTAS
ncbi:MAG: SpoIIE family protein phosphatase [Actinoplanes sp.]